MADRLRGPARLLTLVADYLAQFADHVERVGELVRACEADDPACQEWLARLAEVHGHLGTIEQQILGEPARDGEDAEP